MADNKDTADLFDGMEELGELGEGDFEDLLGDEDSDLANFSAEFDGLMDLADFEELDPSDDSMSGLDGLLDMDSDSWASDSGKENIAADNALDSVKSSIEESMSTSGKNAGTVGKSSKKEQKRLL